VRPCSHTWARMRCGYSRGRYTTGAVLLLYCCRRASSWLGQAADGAASHGRGLGPLADVAARVPEDARRLPNGRRACPCMHCASVHIASGPFIPLQRLTTGERAVLGGTRQYSQYSLRRNLSVELTTCGALPCRANRSNQCGSGAATPCRTSRAALAALAAAAVARPQRLVRAVERFGLDRFRHVLRRSTPYRSRTLPLRPPSASSHAARRSAVQCRCLWPADRPAYI
jgi:hypothetical protein